MAPSSSAARANFGHCCWRARARALAARIESVCLSRQHQQTPQNRVRAGQTCCITARGPSAQKPRMCVQTRCSAERRIIIENGHVAPGDQLAAELAPPFNPLFHNRNHCKRSIATAAAAAAANNFLRNRERCIGQPKSENPNFKSKS